MRVWDKSKPPLGPFTLNTDCPQAQGLVAWWPMGGASGVKFVPDYSGAYHLEPGTAGTATLGSDGRPGMQFVAASNQYLLNADAPVSDWPISLTAWGATDGSTQTAIKILGAAINDFCRIVLVSGKVRANCGTATGPAQTNAITTASYTSGELSLFGATFEGDASRTVYLNGGNAVTDTTAGINPTAAFTRTRLGVALTVADALLQPWNGFLGECGVWNTALSADMHNRLWDPSTRYELWYPLRSDKWISIPAGGSVTYPMLERFRPRGITRGLSA